MSGDQELAKFRKMLGDIGGSDLGALKLPADPIPDLWNFECLEDEKCIFGEIKGASPETPMDDETETVRNNLAMLEVTKLMVNEPGAPKAVFSFESLLKDYENIQTPTELKTMDTAEENIFLDTINNMKLYEDTVDVPDLKIINQLKLLEHIPEAKTVKSPNLTNTPVFKSKVVFRQIQQEYEDSDSSEISESDSIPSEYSEPEFPPAQVQNSKISQPSRASSFDWYYEYCQSQQEKWHNIYAYQLASINVRYSKKL